MHLCLSYFSNVEIKHHGPKQLMGELILAYSSRGLGDHHDREGWWLRSHLQPQAQSRERWGGVEKGRTGSEMRLGTLKAHCQ